MIDITEAECNEIIASVGVMQKAVTGSADSRRNVLKQALIRAGVEWHAKAQKDQTGTHALANSETDTKLLSAWTPSFYAGSHPPFINLTMVRMKGDIVLTVRLPTVHGAPPGATSSVRFTREMWRDFLKASAEANQVYEACDALDGVY